ncbi:MAG: sulfurtransferase [Deltaproteobacteria bacterium]|nr:sulfurtransferase [Deltaproteobacteria bacterium]
MGKSITPEELNNKIASGEKITVLDLRRQADFDADPELIPGALKLDPAKIEEWSVNLPQGQETVIYCARGGSISQSARETLQRKGLKASYIEGGLAAWKKSKQI